MERWMQSQEWFSAIPDYWKNHAMFDRAAVDFMNANVGEWDTTRDAKMAMIKWAK